MQYVLAWRIQSRNQLFNRKARNNMDLSKYNPYREFLLYKTDNGDIKVDVLLQNETIWLPQSKIAELLIFNTLPLPST